MKCWCDEHMTRGWSNAFGIWINQCGIFATVKSRNTYNSTIADQGSQWETKLRNVIVSRSSLARWWPSCICQGPSALDRASCDISCASPRQELPRKRTAGTMSLVRAYNSATKRYTCNDLPKTSFHSYFHKNPLTQPLQQPAVLMSED